MTITPDHAKELLDHATDGIWTTDRDDPDEVFRILSIRQEKGGLVTGTPIADEIDSDGDAAMILSAPDLARTVIDQAEEIAKLRGMISRASCEIDALKNPGIDQ